MKKKNIILILILTLLISCYNDDYIPLIPMKYMLLEKKEGSLLFQSRWIKEPQLLSKANIMTIEIASAYFSSVKYGAGFSKTFEPNSY